MSGRRAKKLKKGYVAGNAGRPPTTISTSDGEVSEWRRLKTFYKAFRSRRR